MTTRSTGSDTQYFKFQQKRAKGTVIKKGNVIAPSRKEMLKQLAIGIINFYICPTLDYVTVQFSNDESISLHLSIHYGIYLKITYKDLQYFFPAVKEVSLFLDAMKYLCQISEHYGFTTIKDSENPGWICTKSNFVAKKSEANINQLSKDLLQYHIIPIFKLLLTMFPNKEGLKLDLSIHSKNDINIFEILTSPYVEHLSYRLPIKEKLNSFLDAMRHMCEISHYYGYNVRKEQNNSWIVEQLACEEADIVGTIMNSGNDALAKLIESTVKNSENPKE